MFEEIRNTFKIDATRASGVTRNGKLAGSIDGKYWRIKFKGKKYQAHRIIKILEGYDLTDDDMVDHINGDGLDNRPCNLRLSNARANSQNKTFHRKGKPLGTSLTPSNKYTASVHLGTFDTEEEAHEAYKKAVLLLGL